jgi:hypothetical protein
LEIVGPDHLSEISREIVRLEGLTFDPKHGVDVDLNIS